MSSAPPEAGIWVRSRRLCLAFALSIALHVDVVFLLDAWLKAAPSGTAQARPTPLSVSVLPIRLQKPQAPEPPVAATTDPESSLAPPEVTPEAVALSPSTNTATVEMPAVQPASMDESVQPGAVLSAEAEYVRAGELSQRPRLLSTVHIDVREGVTGRPPRRAYLRVLINERGGVDNVLVDQSDLPADYEQAARDAFLRAEYAPGEIDGVAVRSQIRIEVTYDGTPPP